MTEVGPRDGFQIERDFIPTATKIELINELVDAGVPKIEYSSFVSPRAVPQLADAAEVLAGVDRSKGTRFAALVPNAKGAERAAEAGVDEIRRVPLGLREPQPEERQPLGRGIARRASRT